MENPYGYKMPYVPYADQVMNLSQLDEKKSKSLSELITVPQKNENINDLTAVSIDAINSMLSMCSMVYMMCIQKLGGEDIKSPFDE